MFSTVRYFIKTSLIFLAAGLLTGIYLMIAKYYLLSGYSQEIISAHTHIILAGSVMMMIMGVALWFFPRPEKDDTKYNPGLISFTYYLITTATSFRFIFQLIDGFYYRQWINNLITVFSILQVAAFLIFFYSMWGRIRSVGSHIREAKGEKF